MRLAPYLVQRLFDLGAAHAFGIPGDLILPLYEALGESPIRPILTTHEPSAGFAADAYARLKGIGVAVGTYGAGALNMVNPAAQAYAEKSPVVVISGARPLQQCFVRIAQRRGKKIAVVALARKLLTTVYGVLKSGQPYDPRKLQPHAV